MIAFVIALAIATTFCVNTETRFVFDSTTLSWIKKPLELVIPVTADVARSSRHKFIEIEKQTSGCPGGVKLDVSDFRVPLESYFTSAINMEKKFELSEGTYQIDIPVPHGECGDWWHFAFNITLSGSDPFLVRACTERYFVRVLPVLEIASTLFKAKFEECGAPSLMITSFSLQTLTLSFN
jgi:hypothetical protein